jgi:hypothetical protein
MGRLALAFSVSVFLAGCAVLGRQPAEQGTNAAPTAWAGLATGWSRLPPPGLGDRSQALTLAAGSVILLWGGDTHDLAYHDDGAVFDAAAGRWRPIPPAPLAGRHGAGGAWTGRELVVWGGRGKGTYADGAAFDLAAREWRELPESPLAPREPVATVWTGSEVLIWGNTARASAWKDGAAYDPATDRWRELAPAPLALNQAQAAWTGREMIVLGSLLDGGNRSATPDARGIAYDPAADSWRVIARYPLSPQASTVVWTGTELVAWDYELHAGAYGPESDTWRPLPDLPLEFAECYPQGALAGRLVLAWHCGSAAVFDLQRDRWRPVASSPVGAAGELVSAGPVALLAGTGLTAFTP